jgi:hypothetical protein
MEYNDYTLEIHDEILAEEGSEYHMELVNDYNDIIDKMEHIGINKKRKRDQVDGPMLENHFESKRQKATLGNNSIPIKFWIGSRNNTGGFKQFLLNRTNKSVVY